MSGFDTPYTFPETRRGGIDGLIDAAKNLFLARAPEVQARGHDLADRGRAIAEDVATRVRAKPIPPALILLGVGIGLTLLFNKRARDATIAAGGYAFDQYKKYR